MSSHKRRDWEFPVFGLAALLCMSTVTFIAFRDEIVGFDGWCYAHGSDASLSDARRECREDARTCELSRAAQCRRDRRVSTCIPPGKFEAARRQGLKASPCD